MAFGYHSDMRKFGPKAHLTATTHNWGDYYTRSARSVLDGTWKSGSVWGGMREGFIRLAPLNPIIPVPVREEVGRIETALKAGRFHPFAGPVKDQSGKEVVAAGRNLTDDELGKMNYYVEGVASTLPKG
jgi:simple sugar transport system substrate-binding protein